MSRSHDRHITIFSPEGRLHQVEYAFAAAKNVTDTGLGYCSDEIAVLVASKKVPDKLINPDTVTSLHAVTKHIGVMAMGRESDCRSSVFRARSMAHEFFYNNGYEIPVSYLAKQFADHFQLYTQHAYRRCYGCEVIFCGHDEKEGPQIFHVGPAGQVFGYKAVAVGGKKVEVNNNLDKHFKDYVQPATNELVIEESILCLMQGTTSDFKGKDLEIMIIGLVEGKPVLRKMTDEEIEARLTAISDRD